MVRSSVLIIILFFFGATSVFAQNADEIKSQQEEVIQHFFKLLLQDSPVTVSQAYEIFNPEQMWNVEYYDESLSEQQKAAFYDGDADTLISRTFVKLDNYKSELMPDQLNEISSTDLIESLSVELAKSSGDDQIRVNQYQVSSSIDENWKVTIGFYGHPFKQISKIIVSGKKEILKEIGLSN